MFPSFESINWFAAERLAIILSGINLTEQKCPNYLSVGLKALVACLKIWNAEKDVRFNNYVITNNNFCYVVVPKFKGPHSYYN